MSIQAAQPQSAEAPPTAAAPRREAAAEPNWMDRIDARFGEFVVQPLERVLFWDAGTKRWLGASIPLVVAWLAFGAVYCTLRMNFINVRGFWHAVLVTKGDYDDPNKTGEVTHFQALASALSATIGLGNIAGVAIGVSIGGPGTVFWLIMAGLFGMSSKFTECTLGQMYRKVGVDGVISGGPMHYLRDGLREMFGPTGTFIGSILAGTFAVLCIGGSLGGGCAFQVVQSLGTLRSNLTLIDRYPWVYGLVMVFLVGIVIIGGIRRIASTADKIVPLMCAIYVVMSVYILAAEYANVPYAFWQIIEGAMTPSALKGGFVGVMVIGIQRAAFSNEAGIGSASIAHSAARTDRPVSEGIVALLEPFIDTVVICTMTGLVIVVTGVCDDPANAQIMASRNGAALSSVAYGSVAKAFEWLLCLVVFLFAYATMISWSYYGERCWSHLFGPRTSIVFRLIYLGFVFLGSVVTADNILSFSDMMILSMAFPNLVGVIPLSGKVRRALDQYWRDYKAGRLERNAAH